jgi:hypothetical protein
MELSNSGDPGSGVAMTFVVRLSRDDAGRLTGVVERVRTGEKARVDGVEAIGPAIARMVTVEGNDDARRPRGADRA